MYLIRMYKFTLIHIHKTVINILHFFYVCINEPTVILGNAGTEFLWYGHGHGHGVFILATHPQVAQTGIVDKLFIML
jgi:hypothetical protein